MLRQQLPRAVPSRQEKAMLTLLPCQGTQSLRAARNPGTCRILALALALLVAAGTVSAGEAASAATPGHPVVNAGRPPSSNPNGGGGIIAR